MKPTTNLEALVRHLSGRGDQGIDLSGDPGQVLEAIRARSRILFADRDDTESAQPGSWLDSQRSFAPRTGGKRRSPVNFLRWALILNLLGVVGAGSWWLGQRSATTRASDEIKAQLAEIRVSVALKPPVVAANPDDLGGDRDAIMANWRQVDAELAAIQGKLDALSRLPLLVAANDPTSPHRLAEKAAGSEPANRPASSPNPDFTAVKADLAAIRRELASGEAATTRQIQEMRTVLHEVNTVVRRVLNRPQPTSNTNVALPLLAVAVQALINNLQHQTAQVRGEAVEQLIRLGPLARSALPTLQHMLTREPDPTVRSAVETAVSVISSN